jgi:pilus assembly protein CpaD
MGRIAILPTLVGHFALAALIGLLLAGCAGAPDFWPTEDDRKELRTETDVMHHAVAFAPDSAQLTAGEVAAIDRFLAGAELQKSDRIQVLVAARDGLALGQTRAETLLAHLAGLGLSASPKISAGAAALEVVRTRVIVPDCPDWSKPGLLDMSNTPSSNFGCATAINLSLMVADPADLARGRELGAADGERMAETIRRYRTGELPAPSASNESAPVSLFETP